MLTLFCKLTSASHVSLRDNHNVTGTELDTKAGEAWKIVGVIGSRMTGGGFGSCIVSLVKEAAIDTFIKEIGATYKKNGIKPEFYIAEISDGACEISE